ncbi:MAG: 50S ribosomal protein L32 [Bacteroidales bacterium]|nr:50S ribosomal protein L32 [Bacteroidales bacterium]MDE7072773.1 50S ribosomal protein L32 [Bacteroidales bacterium]
MPNPKWRFSKTRTRKRRTHDKLDMPQLSTCSNCGSPVLSHHVCPECGYYRGKQVMETHTPNA